MSKAVWIRLIITALVVGCAVYSVGFARSASLPFLTQVRGAHRLVIQPRPHTRMPPELKAGDVIDLRRQKPDVRAALIVPFRLPAQQTYTVTVSRDGHWLHVPVTTTKASRPGWKATTALGFYMALALALALVTLWWGRDWAAWGVTMYGAATVVARFTFISAPPLVAITLRGLNNNVFVPLSIIGLYIMAFALIGRTLTDRLRWSLHALLILAIAPFALLLDTRFIAAIIFANTQYDYFAWIEIAFLSAFIIPLIALAIGYARTGASDRHRLRWVLASLALLVVATEWNNVSRGFGLLPHTLHHWGTFVATIFALGGLTYGLLIRRLVKLSFVVNRGLVYGAIGAVIVGVFALLETIIEIASIGTNAGIVLNIVVSLALGLALDKLRDRIDDLVESVLFRRKHRAEKALNRFIRHCAFIEHRERLLDETVRIVQQFVQPHGVALYERYGGAYVRVAAGGEAGFPKQIDSDDRAFVAMRAELTQLDLDEAGSAVGEEGQLFPMTLRGVLLGALACGARTEPYTPDERELLMRLAHEVGIALHALRARENEALVEALAKGTLAPDTARTRARGLWAKTADRGR